MRLILLGRDGVLNERRNGPIARPAQWRPIHGSLEAVARLNRAGYRVVVVTNQPGIAAGALDAAGLGAIHQRMHRALAEVGGHVEAVCFCPHGPEDGCDCRKPAPGLLRDLAARLHTDLSGVPFIGDSEEDLEAARAVGAEGILVRTGRGRRTEQALTTPRPVYDDLAAAVEALPRAAV